MAFFFVPAGVSIINYFDVLKSTWIQLVVICVISTVVTFVVTAWSVRLTIRGWKGGRSMSEIFASPYFGVALSVIAFGIGVKLNQKFKNSVL